MNKFLNCIDAKQSWNFTVPTVAQVQVYERALAAYVAVQARRIAAFRDTNDFDLEAFEFHKQEHGMAAALHKDLADMLSRAESPKN